MPKPEFPRTIAGRFASRLWEAMDLAEWPDRGRRARWSRRFGVKQPTATAWVTGLHMPTPDKIQEMAHDLGCDFNWLWRGTRTDRHTVRESEPTSYITPTVGADEVRIWSAAAAAGMGRDNEASTPIGTLLFRERSLRRKSINAPEAIYVSGQSMVPRLRDGDTVIFDRSDVSPIRSGKVYVIELDAEALVKRVHTEPGGLIRISSDNRSDPQYQDILIEHDSDRIRVVGRVRWVGSWED